MSHFPKKYHERSDNSVGFSFIRVYNIWHRWIKTALSEIGLTHSQFVVIASLGYLSQFNQEVTQVVIAEASDIDVMTVSTIIKNLEKKELVERMPSLRDSRAKTVQLTENGINVMQSAMEIVEEIDEKFFGQLDEEKDDFNRLLLRLSDFK